MKKTALLIMALAILSKIFGLGRDIVLSYFYGTSTISDAYLIADIIPGVIFGFVLAGLAAGFIPMFTQIERDEGKVEADRFTNNTINLLMIVCTAIVLIVIPFTDQIVKLFASGFDAETLKLTSNLTKITMLSIYFLGTVTIFSGYLQIKNNFIIPVLIGLPLDIIVIASIFFSSKTNTIVLGIGYTIAAASQVVLMIPFMKKYKFQYKPLLVIKDRHLMKMGSIALPVILGVSVDKIGVMIERSLASQVAVGGVSALNYANRLNGFVQAIFVWSITTTLYPMISKMAAEKDIHGLKNTISKSIIGVSLFVLPLAAGSMVFSTPIISLLFGRGAFDDNAIAMTAQALLFYSIGMIGFGLRDILTKAFYSLKDTKTPMILTSIGIIINISLYFVLSKFMGISGLALATSLSVIITSVILFAGIRKKIGAFGLKQVSQSFFKVLAASLLMCAIARISFNFLTVYLGQNSSLLLSVGIGGIIYFVFIYLLKIEDVDLFLEAIKEKFKKGIQ